MMWQVMAYRTSRAFVFIEADDPTAAIEQANQVLTESDFETTGRVSAYEFDRTPSERWYSVDAGWTWPEQPLLEGDANGDQ